MNYLQHTFGLLILYFADLLVLDSRAGKLSQTFCIYTCKMKADQEMREQNNLHAQWLISYTGKIKQIF